MYVEVTGQRRKGSQSYSFYDVVYVLKDEEIRLCQETNSATKIFYKVLVSNMNRTSEPIKVYVDEEEYKRLSVLLMGLNDNMGQEEDKNLLRRNIEPIESNLEGMEV